MSQPSWGIRPDGWLEKVGLIVGYTWQVVMVFSLLSKSVTKSKVIQRVIDQLINFVKVESGPIRLLRRSSRI